MLCPYSGNRCCACRACQSNRDRGSGAGGLLLGLLVLGYLVGGGSSGSAPQLPPNPAYPRVPPPKPHWYDEDDD